MLPHQMRRKLLTVVLLVLGAAGVVACGEQSIELGPNASASMQTGAQIFALRCSGCHTLNAAGTQGSASKVNDREYKDGPNFDQRKEDVNSVLYAIRNGGFSSGPMPQNIVTGQEAREVAEFVARYSGSEAARTVQPNEPPPTGF
jgi:mono/diheme cytochrome c family protein